MSDKPNWDDDFAQNLIGATVLVGLRIIGADSSEEMEQFYGVVTVAVEDHGITLELSGSRGGETWLMPPDLRAFEPASPGEYRLRSTQEVVINPDYISQWTMDKPNN